MVKSKDRQIRLEQLQQAREQKERERQEKEKEKLEKEQERQRVKEQKERDRLEKERDRLEKERDRLEKEHERQKLKEEREREKQEKQRLLDEKKRKEEERKATEQQIADELKAKKEKEKEKFKSYFIKTDKTQEKEKPKYEGRFIPFQLKEGMTLAPTVRIQLPENSEILFTEAIRRQTASFDQMYLREIQTRGRQPEQSGRNLGPAGEDVDILPIDEENSNKYQTRKAKLLQFRENCRPAYFGTWQKRSSVISGRRPFAKDQGFLNYEIDSDDEWEEEPEDGEECRSDDEEEQGEEEPKNDSDTDEDSFLVDHGYLSEGEGVDEVEDDEKLDPIVRLERAKLKDKLWRDEKLNKKFKKLTPIVVGISWFEMMNGDHFSPMLSERLKRFQVVPNMSLPVNTCVSLGSLDSLNKSSPKVDSSCPATVKGAFPAEAMRDFVQLVNNCRAKKDDMIREFQHFWMEKSNSVMVDSMGHSDSPTFSGTTVKYPEVQLISPPGGFGYKISQKQLDLTLKRVAFRDARLQKWMIRPEVLSEHGLSSSSDSENCWIWKTVQSPNVSESIGRKAKRPSIRDSLLATTIASSANNPPQLTAELTKNSVSTTVDKNVTPTPLIGRGRKFELAKFVARCKDDDAYGMEVKGIEEIHENGESPPTKILKLGSPLTSANHNC